MPVVGKSVALFDYFNYKGEDDVYISNPLPGDDYFYNPILPGWYSDPSICTNGEGDYFLAVSTFTYYPGTPLMKMCNRFIFQVRFLTSSRLGLR